MSIKIHFVSLMVIALWAISLYSQTTRQEAAVIRYAKNMTVSRIEPGMPKQSFDRWLRITLGKGHPVKWEVNDCGERPEHPLTGAVTFRCVPRQLPNQWMFTLA
jgi:hypothetical protein